VTPKTRRELCYVASEILQKGWMLGAVASLMCLLGVEGQPFPGFGWFLLGLTALAFWGYLRAAEGTRRAENDISRARMEERRRGEGVRGD
jgi:hypothetical protein